MTSDEIWTEVYDRGYNIGVEKLPSELQLLWYYIDFTIYVDTDGPSGFLYNKSPDTEHINHYAPYLKSWRFFNYNNLADLVEKYNDQFLKAFAEFKKNGETDFDIYQKQFGLDEIEKKIEPKITEANCKNTAVWSWLDQNIERLQSQIDGI
ncbi:MAG: hypothetical protein V4506_02095 [Bacteroidota bacterium]